MRLLLLLSSLAAFSTVSLVAASPVWPPVQRTRSITEPKTKTADKTGKIYNAEGNVQPGELPYYAAINVNSLAPVYVVSGTLISSRSVLTTAEDIIRASSWTVILGATVMSASEPWRRMYESGSASAYPTYINSDADNIGIIHLPQDVEEDGFYIRRALLPTTGDIMNDFTDYAAITAGFGEIGDNTEYSDFLRYTTLRIISNEECIPIYGATPQDVCATGIGTICAGDYGTGLILTNPVNEAHKVVGVAAYGASCEHTNPTLFTRVTSYLEWVYNTAGIPIVS